uniref:Uncharacterized protein n=1 Tax=Loa loa TaxID=7209 RepID=A0A1I7VKF9_LOALO
MYCNLLDILRFDTLVRSENLLKMIFMDHALNINSMRVDAVLLEGGDCSD